MRALYIHGARDLRLSEIPQAEIEPDEVAVRIKAAGICGSDLHYYLHGGFGPVRLKEPLILGHEMAGEILACGAAVHELKVGMRVAINPSRPCHQCRYCRKGQHRHCTDMRFFGSALRFPHIQGGFREILSVPAAQIFPIGEALTFEEAALAEPLAVCLHAARRAELALGQRVLVTGCGPIGILCVALARLAGAAEIVATDISDFPLALARDVGADICINVAENPERLAAYGADKGKFDVLFEASGNEAAIGSGFEVLRPCAIAVQVGLGGSIPIPINALVAKEIDLRGTFRFDEEFGEAVDLLNAKALDCRPLVTQVMPFIDAAKAFELASDRRAAIKVQLSFG